MHLPDLLKAQYTRRFDELIAEGRRILESFRQEQVWEDQPSWVSGSHNKRRKTVTKYDLEGFAAWKLNCTSLANALVSSGSPVSEVLDFGSTGADRGQITAAIGRLRGLQDDFAKGFLDDLGLKIEAEIASDYMGQAEALVGEGVSGHYDHVPAAVLAGAVFEKALKTLCEQQSPPVPLLDNGGKPKMLDLLITDLKKAGVFEEPKAKQLRAWAGIRNAAAHGEFDKFTRADVEPMVKGIGDFLADYLG
jgi:hypothetical protein